MYPSVVVANTPSPAVGSTIYHFRGQNTRPHPTFRNPSDALAVSTESPIENMVETDVLSASNTVGGSMV